jgi:branched-chain amino acid transport system substrate-binding protein
MKKRELKMNRRSFIKMSGGAVVAVGANWFLPKITVGSEPPIKLGAITATSGPVSTMGVPQLQAIQLIVDYYNKQGGVLGRRIDLIHEDDESKKDVGLSKARKLVEYDKVDYLCGIIYSSISMAVQDYTKGKKVLFVNLGSGNDALIAPPYCNRYFFKSSPSYKITSLAIQWPAQRVGPRWYFIADDYSWGKGCIEIFKKAIQKVNPNFKIVGEDYPPFGETNYTPYLGKVLGTKPDGLGIANFGIGYQRILIQAKQMGVKCHIHQQFLSMPNAMAAGDAAVGMTASNDWSIDGSIAPMAKKFGMEYYEKTHDLGDNVAADAINGVQSIFEAVKKAGTTETEAVIETMESMKYPDSVNGPDFYYRPCDHQPIAGLYTVQLVKDAKYGLWPKLLEYRKNVLDFVVPCGQTGCEDEMKRR